MQARANMCAAEVPGIVRICSSEQSMLRRPLAAPCLLLHAEQHALHLKAEVGGGRA